MNKLNINVSLHIIVFDRGCNSKDNLKKVKRLKLHYVDALTPYHHQDLIEGTEGKFDAISVNATSLNVYREKREIWGWGRTNCTGFRLRKVERRTITRCVSNSGKEKETFETNSTWTQQTQSKKAHKGSIRAIEKKILHRQFMEGLIEYELESFWSLTYRTNQKQLDKTEGIDVYKFKI
jgi:hypothetical protein